MNVVLGPRDMIYLLDELHVASYTPNVSVMIETGDPYQAVPRIRVDQPFRVTFQGHGLVNLRAADLTTAEGEEVLTVSALEDYSTSATVLDFQRIQVWPVARATLSGFDPAADYLDIPTIKVTPHDLYPASAT